MNRNDIALPRPFSGDPLPVTASGDLALVSGTASWLQSRLRSLTVRPGRMLHRPEFGAGLASYLGLKGPAFAQRIQDGVRAQLYRDERTAPDSVSVTVTATTSGRFDVTYTARLVDGSAVSDGLR